MALKFKCENCDNEIVTEYLQAGETAHCPNCGKMTTVPKSAFSFDLIKNGHVPAADLRVRDFKKRISEIHDRPDEERGFDNPSLRRRLKVQGKSLLINLSVILILISAYAIIFDSLRLSNDMIISSFPAFAITLVMLHMIFRGIKWARPLLAFTAIVRGSLGHIFWLRYLKDGKVPIVIGLLAATLLLSSGAILLFSRAVETYIDNIADSKRQ